MNSWDWEILRGPVIWLTCAIIFSTGVATISFQYYQKIQSNYMEQKRLLLSAQQRNVKAIDDSKVLTELLPRFIALQEAGVIGDEQRLNWVDTLRDLGERLKIRSLDFRIDERFPYDKDEFVEIVNNFQVYASLMNVKMQILHEGDFLTLLQALRQQAKGLFHVEACELRRLKANVIVDEGDPNLTAECDLLWLTARYDKRLEAVLNE